MYLVALGGCKKNTRRKKFHKISEEKVQGGWVWAPGTGLMTASIQRELECGLDRHVAAGSRAEFHFLYLSNLEVFRLPDLGCLLGHTCHSFKCSTSKKPFAAQDQRKLYKGWSKLSNFTICAHQSRHRVKKRTQEPWPPNFSFVNTLPSQP